jgi:hypothetical protein
VLRVQTITVVTRILSGFGLISFLSSLGAAITTPLNLALHNSLLAYHNRKIGTHIPVVAPNWRFALASLIMGGLTFLLSSGIKLWFLVPISAAFYVGLILLFKAFSTDEIALFRKLAKFKPSKP